MPRWWKELSCVALAGAVLGTALPRVLFPRTVQARGIPLRVRAEERRAATPPAPSEAPSPSARGPARELPAVVPMAVAGGPGPVGGSRPSPLPQGFQRAARGWVIDLRGLGSPRALLAGMQVTPPTEPGGVPDGYRVEHLDRAGYARAAGIRPGDVLLAVDGHLLRSPDEALDAYIAARRAHRVTLSFRRGSERFAVPVEVIGHVEGDGA